MATLFVRVEEITMVQQMTVLRVDISCNKCKTKLLKAVSGLQGVDKVEVDGAKGILSATGHADPYKIIVRTRKAGKSAEVVSIGPPPKLEEKKKPDKEKPEQKAQAKINTHFSSAQSMNAFQLFPCHVGNNQSPQCYIL